VLAVGEVLNRHKMRKHFDLDITAAFGFTRKTAEIERFSILGHRRPPRRAPEGLSVSGHRQQRIVAVLADHPGAWRKPGGLESDHGFVGRARLPRRRNGVI
jgi:hypothetical protein